MKADKPPSRSDAASEGATAENVGVDHRGGNVPVAEELLNRPDVLPVLEEVGGEGVAQGVAARLLPDPGAQDGRVNGALVAAGSKANMVGTCAVHVRPMCDDWASRPGGLRLRSRPHLRLGPEDRGREAVRLPGGLGIAARARLVANALHAGAFSMKPMRRSRSAISALRRTALRPTSASFVPFGRPPGLTTSMRSDYSPTKTLAPSRNQSLCMTAAPRGPHPTSFRSLPNGSPSGAKASPWVASGARYIARWLERARPLTRMSW